MMKRLTMIIMLLFMVTPPAMAEGRFVRGVADNNTLTLLNGETVDLIGINIPEEKRAEAAELIRDLVSGSVVALEYDVEKTSENGDLLAYVWFRYVPRGLEAGDQIVFPENFDVHFVVDEEGYGDFYVLLNSTIVKSGYAEPIEHLPNNKYTNLINDIYEQKGIQTAEAVVEVHAKATVGSK